MKTLCRIEIKIVLVFIISLVRISVVGIEKMKITSSKKLQKRNTVILHHPTISSGIGK